MAILPKGRCFVWRRPSLDIFIKVVAAVVGLLASAGNLAEAASFRQGVSAFNRQDYASASRVFIPLAEQGNPAAQTYLGFMFETGRGVPQNYTEAAMWYRRAAEQGDSLAQYSLGLLYDKGFGVPRDIVEANKWPPRVCHRGTAGDAGGARTDLRCRDHQNDARRDRAARRRGR